MAKIKPPFSSGQTNEPATPAAAEKPTGGSRQAAPKRRSRRWWILFAVVLAGWFLPTIVAKTSLRQLIPGRIDPGLAGRCTVGDATLGWLSPVEARNVVVRGEHGEEILVIPRLVVSKTLVQLAFQPYSLGRIEANSPRLLVVTRSGGSNIEDLARVWPASTSAVTPAFELMIDDANIDLQCAKGAQDSVSWKGLKGYLTSDGHGSFIANLKSPRPMATVIDLQIPAEGSSSNETGSVQVELDDFSLEVVGPIVARWFQDGRAEGKIAGTAKTTWGLEGSQERFLFRSDLTASSFALENLPILKKDRLNVDRLELRLEGTADAAHIELRDSKLISDFGNLTANGIIPASFTSLTGPDSQFLKTPSSLQGNLDLALLTRQLPRALGLREGVAIESGRLQVNMTTGPQEPVGSAGTSEILLTDLRVRTPQGSIDWREPWKIRLDIHHDSKELYVDRLTCDAGFLKGSGSGRLSQARLQLDVDLEAMKQRLERIIDLGDGRYAGQLHVNANLDQPKDAGPIQLTMLGTLKNWEWGTPPKAWIEPSARVEIRAQLQPGSEGSPETIDSAGLVLTTTEDQAILTLKEPCQVQSIATSHWEGHIKGNLKSWQSRLSPWVNFEGWAVAGNVDARSQIVMSPEGNRLEGLELTMATFAADSPDWAIRDRDVSLKGALKVGPRGEVESPELSWLGEALQVKTKNLRLDAKSWGGEGTISVALDRFVRARDRVTKELSYRADGTVSGNFGIVDDSKTTALDWNLVGENIALSKMVSGRPREQSWSEVWREPQLKSRGKMTRSDAQKISIERLELLMSGLSLSTQGQIATLANGTRLGIEGELKYNWATLSSRLGADWKDAIQIEGQGTRPIRIQGVLPGPTGSQLVTDDKQLEPLTGQFGIGWDRAKMLGFDTNAVDINGQLQQQMCQFTPIKFQANRGTISFEPRILFESTGARAIVRPGTIVQQIELSPELCRRWLLFVAPLLADATDTTGTLSFDMSEASIPLSDFANSQVTGVLHIHGANVKPGPGSQQYIALAEQIRMAIKREPFSKDFRQKVLIQMPEQKCDVKMLNGRVYHRQLQFQIDDVIVTTTGSIGMNETLDLLAEVPIQEKWIGDNKLMAGLKGRSIRIPVSGTFASPKIDQRGIAELTRMVGGSMLEGILKDKVSKGLDKIFGPDK